MMFDKWTDKQILDAFKWHLEEVGYIDINGEDIEDFMRQWEFETIEQFMIYEELESENDG